MGLLDRMRGRREGRVVEKEEEAGKNDTSDGVAQLPGKTEADIYATSDSDTLSLEARNEREVQLHPEEVTKDAEQGIQKAEAAALVWSKPALYGTYAWIWVCFFMLALQSAINFNLLQYVYANFQTAPGVTTANVLYQIIGGVMKLPVARTLNLWGRAEGLLASLAVYLLGLVILASCNNPSSYAAGYVLYWVGYDALYLILDVFVADTSGLRNRAFAFAFVGTPFICTAFTGPLAAQSFINMGSWRWGYGAFCIIQPFVFLPLAVVFKFYQRKAEKLGVLPRKASGRTALQSIVHYIHQFDVVGAILLMAAFVIFLLPFSLESYHKITYGSATFIAMVVVGVCLFSVFAAWEKWFARAQFIEWELFRQRTVLGACVLAGTAFFSFYSWDLYFQPFLIINYSLTFAQAGYVVQTYNVGSTFWGVVFGLWVYWTKHFKYTCLFFGLPLLLLGSGLMIHFRGDDTTSIGYIIMCQIFIAFGGGTLVIGEDMAVMASAGRTGVPMMLALVSLSASVGGAIGSAVTSAIYAGTFPHYLAKALPPGSNNATFVETLYEGGYLVQQKYPIGTPIRSAINYAWAQSQKYLTITSTCVLVIAIPAIAVWKNYRVDKQQNKGAVI